MELRVISYLDYTLLWEAARHDRHDSSWGVLAAQPEWIFIPKSGFYKDRDSYFNVSFLEPLVPNIILGTYQNLTKYLWVDWLIDLIV